MMYQVDKKMSKKKVYLQSWKLIQNVDKYFWKSKAVYWNLLKRNGSKIRPIKLTKPWALSPTLWKYSNTLSTLLTTGKYGDPLWPTKIKKRIVPQTRVAYRYKNIHSRPNLSSTGESWFLELSPEGIASYGCRWLDNGRSLLFCKKVI